MTSQGKITIRNADSAEYAGLFPHTVSVFDTVDFASLNSARTEETLHLVFSDNCGRPIMGWIAGRRDGQILAPFSAPYSCPSANTVLPVESLVECMRSLHSYAGGNMRLTLPPDFYAPDLLPALKAAILAAGGTLKHTDYNYHCEVARAADPATPPSRTARQELRRAINSDRMAYEIPDPADRDQIERVYRIIEANHYGKGYPVKMSLDRLADTFMMTGGLLSVITCDGQDAAAQIGYFSSDNVYQPVYWGDLPQWSHMHPMRLLFHRLATHLLDIGKASVIDLGPSSENGIPAYGLCAFKTSMGCHLSLKPTFTI